ncbi:acyl-CoA thioester hydrolase/BAAT C-terminal domain-containing protein [Aerococcus sanguinicola]|uniref:Acyl-CoA thioesterase n=1 Tax=Aerococcus sanguinicola TaxID=119206 RepID=A0A120I940_9LACT|nr:MULTISPECIES: acyl-CoA thioester hydrolase/BAAT C-terminal domain-containing protein [Aerococcus]AMB93713.1 acyl-CoA thioesterase [Aerococcus sanguinicola]MDK7050439.1 acyl-CoA thioester hydrolase/BAAT C-terminal domain-containing protein [Aerococcus sanguinicola]OFT94530.1 acyl-CoA thioesterase [Aerococcus sp. HMSC23C02]PKZ21556.1 acyl-CoA thioesterase [Aerococcus sanguinicola]
MKRLKKIGLGVLMSVIVLFAFILIVRKFNDYSYKNTSTPSTGQYYRDVTNIDLYPTAIKGVDVNYIDEGRLQGFRLTPQQKKHKGVVICFGGSEGSPNFEMAQRLSQEGYETFALFMYGMNNQEKSLVRIPLEQFEDVLAYLDKTVIDKGPISVIGASKGAEYALNLASKYPEISNLVLIAPASYNFSGLDFENYGSSWTYEDEELPYIDIRKTSFRSFLTKVILPSIVKAPISYKETYTSAVEQDPLNKQKMIPVKDVKANILMIAGEEDAMWDSAKMASEIKQRCPGAELISYKDAGHVFAGNGILDTGAMRIRTGGSLEGNQQAQKDSDQAIDKFLTEHHRK